jgi:hypothetical protein
MPVAVDDTRHFETAVELSPEETADNIGYFREQGLQADYEGEGAPPNPETSKPETPADTPQSQTPAEDEPPASGEGTRAPAAVPADEDIDPESKGEWQAAKTDGEKLGRLAKKTKVINELKGTVAQRDGTIEELRRQLAEKDKTPSPAPAIATSSLAPGAPSETAKVEAKPEPPKAKEFAEPRPSRPKFEDFSSADDPIAAHADAIAEYTDKLSDWKEHKRDFDVEQQRTVEREARQREQLATVQAEQNRELSQKMTAARSAHADWDKATNGKFTPVLAYVLEQAIDDGLELAYQLVQPENADLYDSLKTVSQHKETESERQIERRITRTTYEMGRIADELKKRKGPDQTDGEATPENKTPADKTAADTSDTKQQPEQTPPTGGASVKPAPPRREEAAPAPTRSRGAAPQRLEDIPVEDYDARRKYREAHGLL